MISAGTVSADERLRLFLGLRLADADIAQLVAWQEGELGRHAGGGVRIVPRAGLHVTLAFLGSRPSGELAGVVGALRAAVEVARTRGGPIRFAVERYRETRSVGMLVLADEAGRGAALAGDLQERLERLGVYRREARPWLPHLTVLRFRERPRLAPVLPAVAPLVPSDAAAFLSRLHPSGARYEVLAHMGLEPVGLDQSLHGRLNG